MGNGKVGRPLGFKLNEISKKAISDSKKGQKHKQETRDKISRSLLDYFKRRSPLSDEFSSKYRRFDYLGDIGEWIEDVREDLDRERNILTERILNNKRKVEISCGGLIELISHSVTPELLVLFKEHCDLNNLTMEDAMDLLVEDF